MKKSGTTEAKPFRLLRDVKAFLVREKPHEWSKETTMLLSSKGPRQASRLYIAY